MYCEKQKAASVHPLCGHAACAQAFRICPNRIRGICLSGAYDDGAVCRMINPVTE